LIEQSKGALKASAVSLEAGFEEKNGTSKKTEVVRQTQGMKTACIRAVKTCFDYCGAKGST
jgi:hypothetical protein